VIHPKKLHHSKWTATQPENKELHFLVVDVEYGEAGEVLLCEIEAVMSKRRFPIDWRELNDTNRWVQGWK